MQVVHVAHHIDPNVLQFLYYGLHLVSGVVGTIVVLGLVLKCCSRK